jgi:ankyrin repeat protein
MRDQPDSVRILVENGADLNARTEEGLTPLALGEINGSWKAVKVLRELGAISRWNAEHGTEYIRLLAGTGDAQEMAAVWEEMAADGLEPLTVEEAMFSAVKSGHLLCVEVLLAHGADVNGGPEEDMQYLGVAVCEHDLAVVRLLLENGADVDFFIKGEGSPLAYAVMFDDDDIAEALLEYGATLEWGELASGPLFEAAANADPDALRAALDAGIGPNSEGPQRATPLMRAIREGSVECVEVLLERGADPEGYRKVGKPLHAAAQMGSVEIARLLLAHGADVNGMDANMETPLAIARAAGHEDVADLLVEEGGAAFDLDLDAMWQNEFLVP